MNEYDILLSYLDENKPKKKNVEKNQLIKSFEDISLQDSKVDNTRKILEECQEEKVLDTPRFSNKLSVGFDIDKFENLMRSRLIDDYKKLQSYERPYISVTELFYCIRKSYYNRLKYQIDLKKQFNFAYLDLINRVANTIHEYVQEIYNFTETEKTIVSEKYKVKGRIDAIYENFLYEFKTIEERKFSGTYIKEHYYQPIIYSYILNTEYNYNINTITLVYFFRDNLKRKPFSIDLPLDDKIAVKFLEHATLLHNCILRTDVPEPLGWSEDQCKWCSYINYCKKDGYKIENPFKSKKKKEKEKEIDLELPDQNSNKKSVFLL